MKIIEFLPAVWLLAGLIIAAPHLEWPAAGPLSQICVAMAVVLFVIVVVAP